jgi:putative transcriptional regulator
MPGTGGFRKLRVGRRGIGKSGGARVIYILRNEACPVFLISAYAKSEKSNLSQKERNELARRAEEIFAKYRGSDEHTISENDEGLEEVEAFLGGEQSGYKVTVPAEIDVRGIRRGLKMTQARFSATFGFSLDAVKHWEGGRRTPEASARAFHTVISRNPAAVIAALHTDIGPAIRAPLHPPGKESGFRALP